MAKHLKRASKNANGGAAILMGALLASVLLPSLARAQQDPPASIAPAAPPAAPAPAQAAVSPALVPPAAGCAPSGCPTVEPPNPFGSPYRVWGYADFLAWKLSNAPLPPLTSMLPVGVVEVTTNNVGSIPPTINNFAMVSILSNPVLAEGNTISADAQLGARFTAGVWFDPAEPFGVEASGFFIGTHTVAFHNSTGNTALPIDQFLLTFPFNSNIFIATPGTTTAPQSQTFPTFVVRQSVANLAGTSSTGIWGAEANIRWTWDNDAGDPFIGKLIDGMIGVRYVDFHENLQVANQVQLFLPPGFQDTNGLGLPLNTNFPTNLNETTADAIHTRNQFVGGQFGIDYELYIARFFADVRGIAALGVMHESVDVFGATQVMGALTPAQTAVNPGGLLSSALDQGNHNRDRIAVVPEVNVKLGYQFFRNLRIYVGYDFLYLSSVLRPGDQTGISTTALQATVAGMPQQFTFSQPTFRYKATDLVVNGFTFGIEFRY
jgi:hypothetical protein